MGGLLGFGDPVGFGEWGDPVVFLGFCGIGGRGDPLDLRSPLGMGNPLVFGGSGGIWGMRESWEWVIQGDLGNGENLWDWRDPVGFGE